MVKCPGCGEENPPKFRLCGYCGTPLAAAAPAAAVLPVREMRKTVTLLFSDLKDSTALGEQLDSEALHEVKERYFAAMAAEITRHGGKIEKFIGDAIMAVFGLPKAREDDALRAVRAAMGMRAALAKVNRDLTVRYGVALSNRTGVNTGEVVANDDPTADQKLATGDAVNVAARLEQAAPPNEIYLGETTFRLVRDAVDADAVEPLQLKGKAEKVPAFKLVAARGLDGFIRRQDMPMVGRRDELAALASAYRKVCVEQRPQLVTVIGEAGLGKSRLVREMMEHVAAGARLLYGRCLPYGDGITFWPLVGMVWGATGIVEDDPPELARSKMRAALGDDAVAERLASAIGLSPAAFPLHEIYWAARKFVETFAADAPLVALVDDIHWAEPALLDLLEHILDHAADAPILLLATARPDLLDDKPDWGERTSSTRLVLPPLTDAETARVLHNLLGSHDVPEEVVQRIVTAAGGNPLYVDQLLSMLIDNQALRLEGGRWVPAESHAEIKVPPTIQALLEARLDNLARADRATVDPASVIGLEFARPALEAMAPDAVRPDLDKHLGILTRKQFIRPNSTAAADVYRFHNHLVRETVYNGLLKRARANLHLGFVRWADKVNADRDRALEFEEILGYHLEQAHRYLRELGPLDEEGKAIGRDASRRLSSAGRRAFARGDLRAAANLLGRALDVLSDGDPLRIALLPELGEVLLEVGQLAQARALVDEALAAADPQRDRRVKAAAEVVRLLLRLHGGEAVDWTQAAAALTRETIPALMLEQAHGEIAKAWRLVALAQQNSGHLGEAADSIAKVVEHARLAGDQRLVARSSLGLTMGAFFGPTPVPDAMAQCQALIADDLADRQVQNLIVCKIALLHAMNGNCDEAREMCRRARDVLRDLAPGVRAAAASLDLAAVEMLAGDPAAAERELRPDCEMLEKMGETYFFSSMLATLARAVRDQGRDDEALEITRLAERTAAPDDFDAQVLWRCVRAPILARGGALDDAEALVRASLEIAKQIEVPDLHASAWTELAAVLRVRGAIDASRQALDEALRIYEAKGNRQSAARTRAALAAE
jgi:class 3 adenylate cyclase/tetratricopeptide (TPR) repeat protein